ncbi:MAG: HlyC/CorC family transporter [Ignavibacteriales bacterium]|nr:HlyC/CorC family transporter [Ignavibacteriales bacterium]
MTEIITVSILILLNGFFAMSEIALVSSRKSKLEDMAMKGSKGAKTALSLLAHPENFLSSVQIGITMVGIISGLYGGVAIVEDVTPIIASIPLLENNSVEIAYLIVVGIITYLSLVIGELLPKSIAFNDPEGIAIAVAPVMHTLAILTMPLVKTLTISTKILQKILRIKAKQESPLSEEELKLLIKQGAQFGTFDSYESAMLNSVFRFGDRTARSVMTPKRDVIALDLDDGFDVNSKIIFSYDFKVFPVYKGTIDNLIGIIEAKEFLKRFNVSGAFDLNEIVIQPVYIPETLVSTKVVESFRNSKRHFGIVVNESGSFKGIITLHDIIENLLGDLPEKDEIDDSPTITLRKDNSWLVDGTVLA